jgi:hypothetical protein
MAKKCVVRNSLGECIEWVEYGDRISPQFRKAEISCNEKLHNEWLKIVKEKRILIVPERE